MSQTRPVSKKSDSSIPEWDEALMWQRARRLFMALLGVTIGAWIFLLVWVLFVAPIYDVAVRPLEMGADLLVLLAPVLVAAIGVERLLETILSAIEGSWRPLVAYLGYGIHWLKNAEMEVAEARQWLQRTNAGYNSLLELYNSQMKQVLNDVPEGTNFVQLLEQVGAQLDALRKEADEKFAQAQAWRQIDQKRLDEAEKKLSSLTDSPDYRRAKGLAAIILSLLLGAIVSSLTQMRMFAMLGIALAPARIDVLFTGLAIGSLSWPIRSLSTTLSMGRQNVQDFFRLRQIELNVRQAEAENRQREMLAALLAASRPGNTTASVHIGGAVIGRDAIDHTHNEPTGNSSVGLTSVAGQEQASTEQAEPANTSSVTVGGDVTGRDKIEAH